MKKTIRNILILLLAGLAYPTARWLLGIPISPITSGTVSGPLIFTHLVLELDVLLACTLLGFVTSALLSSPKKWRWLLILPIAHSILRLLTSSVTTEQGFLRWLAITALVTVPPFMFLVGALIFNKRFEKEPNKSQEGIGEELAKPSE